MFMRRIIQIFLIIIFLPICVFATAGDLSEEEKITDEILSGYVDFYGDTLEDGIEKLELDNAFTELIPDFDVGKILKALTAGELDLSPRMIFSILLKSLLGEVYRSMRLMAMVMASSILCSYLTGIKDGFGEKGVSQAAYYACYIVMAGIAATAFYDVANGVSQAIGNISIFMEMIVPVVITTLVTSGAMISATVFEPVLLAIVEIAVKLIQTLLIPLVMIASSLNIVNGISDKVKIQRLIKFINQCVKWGLSVMLTVFVSIAGIQSIAASGADGLTVKLTKFAAANLIPVVGGILSESVETVMNCSALIKNSVGVLGIICLIVIAVTPLLKIVAILLIFRLTAAAMEPVSEPRIIVCLSELANSISVLFSMLAATTVMFVIVLTIVINAGNTALMLGR